MSRRAAALESAVARWLAARAPAGGGARLARLLGGPARVRVVGSVGAGVGASAGGLDPADPGAARAEVRAGGASIVLAASPGPVRALAQRLLGGPAELPAPRPLGVVEQAIWALAVAAACEDAGVPAEVWPLAAPPAAPGPRVELAVELPPGLAAAPLAVIACLPADLELRAPPPRELPAWTLALPLIAGRCAIARGTLGRLAPRDVVTLERALGSAGAAGAGRGGVGAVRDLGVGLELVIGDARIGLCAAAGAMDAAVATGYVRGDMALPDDAHLELTVQLGTARLSLRRIAELAIGEIVPLGRPLAGPYEVRAAGQLVGHGELLDVDGELGVRIVSLATGESTGTASRSGQE